MNLLIIYVTFKCFITVYFSNEHFIKYSLLFGLVCANI